MFYRKELLTGDDVLSNIPRITLSESLSIPRVLHGLWQIADMEKDGDTVDPEMGASALAAYASAGFDGFDMADHYGTAEDIAGRFLSRSDRSQTAACLTKWCPDPGYWTSDDIRAALHKSFKRLGQETIDLMQFHWWHYPHPGYLDCLREMAQMKSEGAFRAIGLTNTDTDHLALILNEGIPIATNQVCLSLLDNRATGRMATLCTDYDVKLLCYGALAGGYLTDRWLDHPEPPPPQDWSAMKYRRFIDAVGGWDALQRVLKAARKVADRHYCSIATVATRWVLDQPCVGAVIVGVRLGGKTHLTDTEKVFNIALSDDDHAILKQAMDTLTPIAGDCGDEYRKPPFLTASGDLSHHIASLPPAFQTREIAPGRKIVDSGSVWEDICGFSRAMRVGDRILVSGTTATHSDGRAIAPGNAELQTVYILDKIQAAIEALGGSMRDVVRTRVYLDKESDWEPVSHAHGRVFQDIRPANTLFEIGRLIDGYAVEIEAEAVLLDD